MRSKLPSYMRPSGIRFQSDHKETEVIIMNTITDEKIGIFYRDLPEEWKSECDEYLDKFNIKIE